VDFDTQELKTHIITQGCSFGGPRDVLPQLM